MASEVLIKMGNNAPVKTSASNADWLEKLVGTDKPALRYPYESPANGHPAKNSTPSLEAAEMIAVKFGKIIHDNPAKAKDVFIINVDGTEGKRGWTSTITRGDALTYAKDLLSWAKASPVSSPHIEYTTEAKRRSRSTNPEDYGEND